MERGRVHFIYLLFALTLLLNIALWHRLYPLREAWANIPPPPGNTGMTAFAMGDRQFAFRATALMLQNFGNGGGQEIPLKDYDYNQLGKWLFLSDTLDPVSDFVPFLAAFYFSFTQNPAMLPPIVDYLEAAGRQPGPEKWRWLAQAVFIARFREHDTKRALQLANELAAEYQPGRPLWLKEMPAFVMTDTGDKKAAYGLMLAIIKSEEGKVQQPEINSTINYICRRILDRDAAAANPLCAHTLK